MTEESLSIKRKLLVALIFLVAAIILTAILHFWSTGKANKQQPAIQPPPQPKIAVIEITPNGFVPQTLNVQPNTKVTWLNEDVKPHLPAADPYPSHTSLQNLIAPMALGQKETYSFLFSKPAKIGYHDQLQPTLTGTVVVR